MAPKPTRVERQTKLHSEAVFVDWRSCSSPPHIYVPHDEFRPHLSQDLKSNEDIEIRIQVPGKEVGGIDRRPLYSKYSLLDECWPDGRLRARIDMSNVHGYILNTKAYKVEIVSGDELQVWSSDLEDWFVLGLVTPKCPVCSRETSNSGSEMLRCENCKRPYHRPCAAYTRGRFVCGQCQTYVAAGQKVMEVQHQERQASQGLDEEQVSHESQSPLEKHRESSQQDIPSPERRQPVASLLLPPSEQQQQQQQVSQQQRQSQQQTPEQRHAQPVQEGFPQLRGRQSRSKQQQQQQQLLLSQPSQPLQPSQQQQQQQQPRSAVEEDSCSNPGVQRTVQPTGRFARKRLAQPDSGNNYANSDGVGGAGNSAARSVGKGDDSRGLKRQRRANGSLPSAPVDDYETRGHGHVSDRDREMETGDDGEGERASMPPQEGGPIVECSGRSASETTAQTPRRATRRDRRVRISNGAAEESSEALMGRDDDTAAAETAGAPAADDKAAGEGEEPTDRWMETPQPAQQHQDGQDASAKHEIGGDVGQDRREQRELQSEDERLAPGDSAGGGGGAEIYADLASMQDVSDSHDDGADDAGMGCAAAGDGTDADLAAAAPDEVATDAAATVGDREPAGDGLGRSETAIALVPSSGGAASVDRTCSQGNTDPSGSGGAAAAGGSVANPDVAAGREASAAGTSAPEADSVIGREAAPQAAVMTAGVACSPASALAREVLRNLDRGAAAAAALPWRGTVFDHANNPVTIVANGSDDDGGNSDGGGAAEIEDSDPYLEALLREFPVPPYGVSLLPPPLPPAPTVSRPTSACSRLHAPPELPASCPEYLRTVYGEICQALDRGVEESVFARKLRQADACWQRLVKLYGKQKARLGRRCSAMQRQRERLTRQLEQNRMQLRRQADELQALQAASAAAGQVLSQSQEEEARLRRLVSELQEQLQLMISGKAVLETRAAAAEEDLIQVRSQLASVQKELKQVEDAHRQQQQELELQIEEGRRQHQQELQQQAEDFRRRNEQELEDARRWQEQELQQAEDARRRLQQQVEEAAQRQQGLKGQLEEAQRQHQQQLNEARQEVAALRSQLAAATQGGRGAVVVGAGQGSGPVGGRVNDGLGYAPGAGHGHGLRAEAPEAGENDRIYIEQLEATITRLRTDVMRQMAERMEERRSLEAEVERWRQLARRNPARASVDYSPQNAYQQTQLHNRAAPASELMDPDGPLAARGPGVAAAGSSGFLALDGPSGSGADAGLPYQHQLQPQGTSSLQYQNGQGYIP
ncbi:hypothetical protein Vretifemale_7448 [Volvox reticuliferus]|nr:hypothetical protein Vretifemale_7448 [Volvox reticuliferus]